MKAHAFLKVVALQMILIFTITYLQWLAILTALLNHQACR